METEVWKNCVGLEHCEVSNLGNVRKRGIPVKQHKMHGYKTINVTMAGKVTTKRVHRLVIEAFICSEYDQVDHIDGNRENNSLSNLRPCTRRENALYRHKKDNCGAYRRKKDGKYVCQMKINKKSVYLGSYDTPEMASMVYKAVLKAVSAYEGSGQEFIAKAQSYRRLATYERATEGV